MINQIAKQINETCHIKGFWPETPDQNLLLSTKIALIHSEASECLEALRANQLEAIESEFADIIIRVLDLAYEMGYHDMENAITAKMDKNSKRAFRHGKQF